MKLWFCFVVIVWGLGQSLLAQTKPYTVAFYNLENLFDTLPSPGVLDREFTPEGSKAWNSAKYWKKIGNIEEVIYQLAGTNKSFPTIIGVSEIENRNVLEDLVAAAVNATVKQVDETAEAEMGKLTGGLNIPGL